jgi:hypothetical protein
VKATIGRVVWYRSKTGRYTLPADVAVTVDTIYPPAVEAGFMPPLDDENHVHLIVKTAGIPGTRLPDTDPSIKAQNMGGTYVEHNIPFWDPEVDGGAVGDGWADDQQPAGTWTWPRRA